MKKAYLLSLIVMPVIWSTHRTINVYVKRYSGDFENMKMSSKCEAAYCNLAVKRITSIMRRNVEGWLFNPKGIPVACYEPLCVVNAVFSKSFYAFLSANSCYPRDV